MLSTGTGFSSVESLVEALSKIEERDAYALVSASSAALEFGGTILPPTARTTASSQDTCEKEGNDNPAGRMPCCRAASILPSWNSRCKIELIFGIMLQFNVVWCIRSRREIVLTIQSDNGKQGYKVGGKKYRRPKVVLPRGPCERYSSDWIRRRDQSWARSVGRMPGEA